MKTQLLKKLFLASFVIFGFTNVSAQLYDFDVDLQGWDEAWGAVDYVTYNATEGVSGDGALQVDRTSNNSGFGLLSAAGTGPNGTTQKFVRMRYKNTSNATSFRFQGDSSDGAIAQTVFSIGANSTEYVTGYFDLTGVTNWSGTLDNIDILVRGGWASGEGSFFLDEIEFLDTMPPVEYSEFIKNPSFDGPSGISHLTGARTFANYGITSTESHDGSQSLRFTYTADAASVDGGEAGTFWVFSNYEEDYNPTLYTVGSEIEIKMWVKTNRTTPITISSRVKLGEGADYTQAKPIQSVTTTNTAMGWEELTFTLVSSAAFDRVTYWFAINYLDPAGDPTPTAEELSWNLLSGDIVYIDQLSATILDGTLSVSENVLDGVKLYPNPTSDILNVSCPAGTNLDVYNVLGVLVQSEKEVQENHTMNVSNLSSGMYFLKMQSEGKTTTIKFQVK